MPLTAFSAFLQSRHILCVRDWLIRTFDDGDTARVGNVERSRAYVLTLIAVAFGIAFPFVTQPHWTTSGAMWAEMATNYFAHARTGNVVEMFFSTDFGYYSLPLRMLAAVGYVARIDVGHIAYFYTWSAIVLMALALSTFCLPAFRVVVKDDFVRFITACVLLVITDFETRSFINFTYYAALFIALVAMLALAKPTADVPRWSWVIVLLVVSKPAALSALPALLIAALCNGNVRIIRIATATLVLAGIQFGRMLFSMIGADAPQALRHSLVTRVGIAVFRDFFGIIGVYVFGPGTHLPVIVYCATGFLVISATIAVVVLLRRRGRAMPGLVALVVGVSLLFFNALLHEVAYGSVLKELIDNEGFNPFSLRHAVVGFCGWMLMVAGAFDLFSTELLRGRRRSERWPVAPLVMALIFGLTGWPQLAVNLAREPVSPNVDNSQWEAMVSNLQDPKTTACVPIDPLGWVYGTNCQILNVGAKGPVWIREVAYGDPVASAWYDLPLDALPRGAVVRGVAVIVRPRSGIPNPVQFKLRINGAEPTASTSPLRDSGGMLYVPLDPAVISDAVAQVEISVDSEVELGRFSVTPGSITSVLWLGALAKEQMAGIAALRQ